MNTRPEQILENNLVKKLTALSGKTCLPVGRRESNSDSGYSNKLEFRNDSLINILENNDRNFS